MTVQLYCGDCLEILPTLADKSVDAVITDLPYGTTACSWDEVIPFAPMWEQVKRICKGVFVTTASQPFTSKLVMSAPDMFRYEWVWNKKLSSGFLDANRRPLKVHENICVFSQSGHIYNPQKTAGKPNHSKGNGRSTENHLYGSYETLKGMDAHGNMKYPVTILEFQKPHPSVAVHPTQKPVDLYEYLIRTYTNEGDTVLDFCMGSGTTGVAALRQFRNFIGIEKRPEYFKIAEERIEFVNLELQYAEAMLNNEKVQ